jgi:hypothetical protein
VAFNGARLKLVALNALLQRDIDVSNITKSVELSNVRDRIRITYVTVLGLYRSYYT